MSLYRYKYVLCAKRAAEQPREEAADGCRSELTIRSYPKQTQHTVDDANPASP